MARFTVVWSDSAEDRLAEIWLSHRDPAVQRAADTIDRALAIDPESKGMQHGDRQRALRAAPLEVIYFVSDADRQVMILAVKNFLDE